MLLSCIFCSLSLGSSLCVCFGLAKQAMAHTSANTKSRRQANIVAVSLAQVTSVLVCLGCCSQLSLNVSLQKQQPICRVSGG